MECVQLYKGEINMEPLNYEEYRLKIAELNKYQGEIKLRLDYQQYNKDIKAKMNLEILGLANAMQRETCRIQLENINAEAYKDYKKNSKRIVKVKY